MPELPPVMSATSSSNILDMTLPSWCCRGALTVLRIGHSTPIFRGRQRRGHLDPAFRVGRQPERSPEDTHAPRRPDRRAGLDVCGRRRGRPDDARTPRPSDTPSWLLAVCEVPARERQLRGHQYSAMNVAEGSGVPIRSRREQPLAAVFVAAMIVIDSIRR